MAAAQTDDREIDVPDEGDRYYDPEEDHWLEFDGLEGGWAWFTVDDPDRPEWTMRRVKKSEWPKLRDDLVEQ